MDWIPLTRNCIYVADVDFTSDRTFVRGVSCAVHPSRAPTYGARVMFIVTPFSIVRHKHAHVSLTAEERFETHQIIVVRMTFI